MCSSRYDVTRRKIAPSGHETITGKFFLRFDSRVRSGDTLYARKPKPDQACTLDVLAAFKRGDSVKYHTEIARSRELTLTLRRKDDAR